MKIFITGATGFIGTHLAQRLAQSKHDLVCLVRKTSNVRQLEELGATLITGDLSGRDHMLEGMNRFDWVLHLARTYSYWEPNKRVYAGVNVAGTRNVLKCALESGVSKVVHVSTATVFGKPEERPFNEESSVGPVRFSEYARTKYEGDLITWQLYRERGLPLVVIYPGAVLGPGDSKATGQYIRDLIHRRLPATSFNDAVLTFVHVWDVAEAIVKSAEKQNNVGERYLVGKHQLSLGTFNQMVSEISGASPPKLHLPGPLVNLNAALLTSLASLIHKPPLWSMSADQMRTTREGYRFDGGKAERELGVTYTPIRVALEEAIASYRS